MYPNNSTSQGDQGRREEQQTAKGKVRDFRARGKGGRINDPLFGKVSLKEKSGGGIGPGF